MRRNSALRIRPEVASKLDLKCCRMPLNLKAFAKENLDRTIENNRVPWQRVSQRRGGEGEDGLRKFDWRTGRFLEPNGGGMPKAQDDVGYHAHPFDFAKIAGANLPVTEPHAQPVRSQPLREGAHDRLVLRAVSEEDRVGSGDSLDGSCLPITS